jgi:etoposide-induced 2.4 mRNA
MILTSVVLSFSLGYIPFVGPTLGFIFLCWVDSYYCFEYVWISRGLSLSRRVRHLEERWAYYLAFGLPSAALCSWGSSLANTAIFALSFPVYIILAIHAHPVPTEPYNPVPPTTSSSGVETIRHPSPFIPIRLPIFAIVIWLNDWIVKALSIGQGTKKSTAPRTLVVSNEWVESAEEGEGVELHQPRQPLKSLKPEGKRIGVSTRRKVD